MAARTSRLKVCHVFAGTEGGRWVYEQLKALKEEHGCDVHAVLGGDHGPTVELCRNAGISVKAADFRFSGWSIFTLPWRIVTLAWWMRQQRFDVVQSHVLQSTVFARPAAWLADVPVRLVMVAGPLHMQTELGRWLEKQTAFMETGIIPSCELTGQLYREAGIRARAILPTLYYGPDANHWDPAVTSPAGLRAEFRLPPETPLIGCIAVIYPRFGSGSLTPPEIWNRHVKGHDDLIRAMPTVLKAFPNAKLVLVGWVWGPAGAEADAELRSIVTAEGLAEHVIFTGYRGDVASVYMDIDVSVQASLNENLGGTIESLLMARPTVATRVGGMVDSVIDGQTGVLVNASDPLDLARGIIQLLSNREEAWRLGKAGREHMLSRFTLDTTARELKLVYSRQRSAASSPWRLRYGVARLCIAAWLLFAILGRLVLWDHYACKVLPKRCRRIVLSSQHLGLKFLRRCSGAEHPA